MVLDVLMVPSEQAEPILSMLASSKLSLEQAVALVGDFPEYWSVRAFYERLGLSSHPAVVSRLSSLLNQGIARSLASATFLDRASSTVSGSAITVDIPEKARSPQEACPEDPGEGETVDMTNISHPYSQKETSGSIPGVGCSEDTPLSRSDL